MEQQRDAALKQGKERNKADIDMLTGKNQDVLMNATRENMMRLEDKDFMYRRELERMENTTNLSNSQWHGANFTFLVWGIYHGAFLVIERAGLGAWLDRRPAVLRHVYTLLVVMVGWVFFRSTTMTYAWAYLGAMFGFVDGSQLIHMPHPPIDDAWIAASAIHPIGLYANSLSWTMIAAGVVGSMPWLPRLRARTARLLEEGRTGAWLALEAAGLLGLALVFVRVAMDLAAGAYNPFIYFRF
jgi:alginate O-acetyltransferase complex protein AlgI